MSDDEPSFRVLCITDEEPVPIAGGTLDWIPVRRRLGIGGFGTNAYRAKHAGDAVIEPLLAPLRELPGWPSDSSGEAAPRSSGVR
jgi:hypothetical protein